MIFLSKFTNKLDSKGRISVPSQFRNILTTDNNNSVILYPSFIHECIEACTYSRINRIAESIDNIDPYSEERDSFATSILGGCEQLNIDKDGRINLPQEMIEFAKLNKNAVFVGKGQTFEIWNKESFEEYESKAKEIAKNKRGLLKINKLEQ